MNKILLIISREYLTRVRKRSFIIMTILGPLLFGGIFGSLIFFNKADTTVHTIVVVDQFGGFKDKFKNTDRIRFIAIDGNVDSLKAQSKANDYSGILVLPKTGSLNSLADNVTFYSESQPGIEVMEHIKTTLEEEINRQKYISEGIDAEKLAKIKTDVNIKTLDMSNKETSSGLVTGIGFGGGLLIYMFILLYGVQVMRGVTEEKTSRIVEVIMSSVKPFQLMMGKIVGVALVGLTQFLMWVILSTVVISFVTTKFGDKDSMKSMQSMPQMQAMKSMNAASTYMKTEAQPESNADMISNSLKSINFVGIILAFIFYFLAGYLLYSALFAAIGSAVDAETDTQQFMLPVTLPLILAYVASITAINNPDGAVAFWFSIIPFTSPIVMMVRIPFGVPGWQLALSMSLLVLGFLFTTWLAAKIYRTGILMYGKKVSYREIAKWIRYRN
jgi:ABC-2 type transport system permease protein